MYRYIRSTGLGYPPLHTILFDDEEEATMLLWDGDNKVIGAHFVSKLSFFADLNSLKTNFLSSASLLMN
jgi:hypothetical protein